MIPGESWARAKELFHQALEQPPHQRPKFLRSACQGDGQLLAEVESLLAADGHNLPWLSLPVFEAAAELLAAEPATDLSGQRVGRFRLLRPIGQGGMGQVYLAERADGQFEQRAALKLVHRASGGGTDFLDAFKQERQIVASLEHPNIARLLDGGVTDDGTPYLVMELVEGEAIDHYCQIHDLTLDERLRLFQKVCAAVHHAHRHLVVHCDLKPSNILVNEEGEPKLLDFGISKLLSGNPSLEQGREQGNSSQPLTPGFASPEQLRNERPTTASDVYSLAILLHFLLTGSLPYRLTGTTRQELESSIRELDPAPPSSVDKRLAGDIDAIVAKALRHDPARRYSSVEQFAEDIERHQNHLPVSARLATPTYRTASFLRRHWLVAAAATATTVALLVGLVTSFLSWQAEAKAHAQTEDALSLVGDVFRQLDPSRARDPDLRVLDLLDEMADRLGEELDRWPSLHQILGDAYLNLGQTDLAKDFFLAALEQRERKYGTPHSKVAETLNSLALLYRDLGDLPAAERHASRSLDMRRAVASGLPEREARLAEAESLNTIGQIRRAQGDFAAARTAFAQSLALRLENSENQRKISISLNNLGVALISLDEPLEAQRYLEKALTLRRELYGDRHFLVANTLNNLGRALEDTKDPAAAKRYEEAVTMYRDLFPEGHTALAKTLTNLAGVLYPEQPARAHKFFDEAMEIHERLGSRADLAESLAVRGEVHYNLFEYRLAEPSFELALELQVESLGAGHPDVAQTLSNLAWVKLMLGELPTMEERLRAVLAAMGAPSTPVSAHQLFVEGLLGLALKAGGGSTEGDRLLNEAQRQLQALGESDLKAQLDELASHQTTLAAESPAR